MLAAEGHWMKRRNHSLFFVIASLFAAVIFAGGATHGAIGAQAQGVTATDDAAVAEVKKLESERLAAGLRRDVEGFAAVTGNDYVQIDVDGNLSDKKATLARMKSGSAQLTSNPVDDMLVRVYGNTAVVTGRARPTGIAGGKEFSRSLRYTRVYAKRDGRWQIVLFQQTAIANDK
jgi:uncharacterized protein (TIGR02246 family)